MVAFHVTEEIYGSLVIVPEINESHITVCCFNNFLKVRIFEGSQVEDEKSGMQDRSRKLPRALRDCMDPVWRLANDLESVDRTRTAIYDAQSTNETSAP